MYLYDNDENFTEAAHELTNELQAAIEPIIVRMVGRGYKIREALSVALISCNIICMRLLCNKK